MTSVQPLTLGREFSLVLHKGSEEFNFPNSFCNKKSSYRWNLWKKWGNFITYLLFVVIVPDSIKDVHSHHSQGLVTFILKTFLCVINLHPLTDKGKCLSKVFFFFLFSVNTIISFQTLWNTLYAFYLYIFRFFRLENHFCNLGPGDQRAGSIADDSISWLWHPHLTACISPFPGLNGNLEAIVKTQ